MRLRHTGGLLVSASFGLVLGTAGCDDETTATTPTGATPSGSTATGTPTGQGGAGGTGGAATGTPSGQGGSAQGGGGAGQGGNGSGGGCLTCFQIWIQQGDPAQLCSDGNPSSEDRYNDLRTCACAACDAECGANFCNNQPPSSQCGTCAVPACGPQTTACYQDQ